MTPSDAAAAQAALIEAELANISFQSTSALRGGSIRATADAKSKNARLQHYMSMSGIGQAYAAGENFHNPTHEAPAVQAPVSQVPIFAPKLYQPGRKFVNEFSPAKPAKKRARPGRKNPNQSNIASYLSYGASSVRPREGVAPFGGLKNSRFAAPHMGVVPAPPAARTKRPEPVPPRQWVETSDPNRIYTTDSLMALRSKPGSAEQSAQLAALSQAVPPRGSQPAMPKTASTLPTPNRSANTVAAKTASKVAAPGRPAVPAFTLPGEAAKPAASKIISSFSTQKKTTDAVAQKTAPTLNTPTTTTKDAKVTTAAVAGDVHLKIAKPSFAESSLPDITLASAFSNLKIKDDKDIVWVNAVESDGTITRV